MSPRWRMAAVLFDFNGVLIEDEPWHWQAVRDTVAPLGIDITWQGYIARYLHFDDHGGLRRILDDAGVRHPVDLDQLVARKRQAYRDLLPADGGIDARVARVVRDVAAHVPVAIVSSAPRSEIVHAVREAGLTPVFATIVGAEDVSRPKPDPEGYLLGVRRLIGSGLLAAGLPVLAVEDSPGGTKAARDAGLEVLGVTTTYDTGGLRAAGAVRTVSTLAAVSAEDLLR